MLESHRVPRNIRRNCAHLRVADGIGLVCDKGNPTIKDRPFAFISEWSSNPCSDCPNYDATSRIFKGTIEIPEVSVLPVEHVSDAYTIDELEESSKGSAYEFTPEELEIIETVHEELQRPLEQRLIDEKNGFQLQQACDVQCCGSFFSSPFFMYQDSSGYLYYVRNDMPVRCANEHHLKFKDLKPHKYTSFESEFDPDGFWTTFLEIQENPLLHTRFPRLCGNAKPLESHLHKCYPHNIRLGENALICQSCIFWVLKGEDNKKKNS